MSKKYRLYLEKEPDDFSSYPFKYFPKIAASKKEAIEIKEKVEKENGKVKMEVFLPWRNFRVGN